MGGYFVAQQKFNPNIGCNVQQCRYLCKSEDRCSLDQIDVHQEARNVTSEHNTCCHSFELKE